MDFDPVPFLWTPAVLMWLIIFGAALAVAAGTSFAVMLVTRGGRGLKLWGGEVEGLLRDLFSVSPRRILALAQLTFRESIRRKALLVFVVFAILFIFGSWFLSGGSLAPEFQVKVYVSFVLRAIGWLILPVTLLLSCWGIPEDIRIRSLHTVVTKPARRLEVVLGRVLGYAGIGAVILVVMGLFGWGFIRRQIKDPVARSQLTCRQPAYGKLTFKDREGLDADAGINTGDLNMFRSFIEGATKARAIWTFSGINEGVLDKEGKLQIETRFQAFRSHKGDMKRSLYYQMIFVNPETGLRVPTELKTVNEFRGRTDGISRTLLAIGSAAKADDGKDAKSGPYDIIKDLTSKDGKLQVEVACIDPGQYIGMARPDLFIRLPDRPFEAGYFKAILGIGLMMFVVTLIGVTISTFVKGPVAALVTLCVVIIGQGAKQFMGRLISGQEAGSGVLESIYRIITHLTPSVPLPDGPATRVMTFIDGGVKNFLWLMYQVIPDFTSFNMTPYVANGFDVPWNSSVLPSLAVTLAYLLPCILLGHLCLRIRELESK